VIGHPSLRHHGLVRLIPGYLFSTQARQTICRAAVAENAIFLAGFSGMGLSVKTKRFCRPMLRRASICTDHELRWSSSIGDRDPCSNDHWSPKNIHSIGTVKTVAAVLLINCS
jgi:hypothetical protein